MWCNRLDAATLFRDDLPNVAPWLSLSPPLFPSLRTAPADPATRLYLFPADGTSVWGESTHGWQAQPPLLCRPTNCDLDEAANRGPPLLPAGQATGDSIGAGPSVSCNHTPYLHLTCYFLMCRQQCLTRCSKRGKDDNGWWNCADWQRCSGCSNEAL